jgi:hypothetical protein
VKSKVVEALELREATISCNMLPRFEAAESGTAAMRCRAASAESAAGDAVAAPFSASPAALAGKADPAAAAGTDGVAAAGALGPTFLRLLAQQSTLTPHRVKHARKNKAAAMRNIAPVSINLLMKVKVGRPAQPGRSN